MRKLGVLIGLLFLVSVSASAQSNTKFDVFAGYGLEVYSPNAGSNGPSSTVLNGGVVSFSYDPYKYLGLVAEFAAGHAGTISVPGVGVIPGASANATSYLFGPKFYVNRGKFTPFAQVLFGGVRTVTLLGAAAPPHDVGGDAFAMAFGGGFDWNATRHVAVRLAQVDYLLTTYSATSAVGAGGTGSQNNFRYSAGVVFRF